MSRVLSLVAPLPLRTAMFALILWSMSSQDQVLGQGIVVHSIPAESETNWSKPSFWETIDGQPVESSWEFADGEIRLARPRGGAGSLLSGPLPSNFELSWQWKIEAKTNTGLKYRVRKFGNRWLGVEYQIIDDSPSDTGKGSTASIYDLVGPSSAKPLNAIGQWNTSRVVAIGNRLEHYLNGKLVTSARTKGPVWDSRFAVSKFWGADGFGAPASGQESLFDRIMLTDHGGKAVYRDFKFVVHDSASDPEHVESKPPFLGNAIRNSWADQHSIVIWTRTTQRPNFVNEGPDFVALNKNEQPDFSENGDHSKLLTVQLPSELQGTEPKAALDQMLGACPGVPGQVRLSYFPTGQRKAIQSTPWITTTADRDFTAQWRLEDLKPGRDYAAVVEARPIGSIDPTAVTRGRFRTAPLADRASEITFCMTTCHDFIRRDNGLKGHKIYPSMAKIEPDFVVHAGDIEYYDKERPWAWTIDLMRFKWGRIFALPDNRDFYRQTSSYFLKDDHDTLKNDCWAGQTFGAVTFEQGVKLFNEEQFPSHTPRYKTVRWGRDLQIWLLEGRDYRSPNNMPDGPDKTILGREQKDWLRRTLKASDARFKLIFSPTPIVGPDRKNKKDNHANEIFVHEGDELRAELTRHDGVIVLCGDRHWQYASVDASTSLWEFGCGPGSQKHQFGWKKGDRRPIHRFLRVAGGFLTGEISYNDDEQKGPRLTIRHRKVSGEPVSEFTFPPSPQIEQDSAEP